MDTKTILTDFEELVLNLDVVELLKLIKTKKDTNFYFSKLFKSTKTKKNINFYFSKESPYPNYHILKVISLRYNFDKEKSSSFLNVLFKNYFSINELVDEQNFPSFVVTKIDKPKDLITFLISIDYENKIKFTFLIDLFYSNKLSTSKKLEVIDELIKYDARFLLKDCGDFIYDLLSSKEVDLSKKIVSLLFLKDNEIKDLKEFDIYSILPEPRITDFDFQDFTITKESLVEFLITNDVELSDKIDYIDEHINEFADYYDSSMDSIISLIIESKPNDAFELVKYFLDSGFCIEKEGRSSLIKAVKLGERRFIELLTNYSFNINFKDVDDMNILSCLPIDVNLNLDNHFSNLKSIINSVEDDLEVIEFLTAKYDIEYNGLTYNLNFLEVFTRFNNFTKYNELVDLLYRSKVFIGEIYNDFELLDFLNSTNSKEFVYSFINHDYYIKELTLDHLIKMLLTKNLLSDYLSENILDINSFEYFEFYLVEMSNTLGEEVILEAIETFILADYDFDINKSCQVGDLSLTLLDFASSYGLSKIVRFLFSKNAYYKKSYDLFYSALAVSSIPIINKRLNTVKTLIELGVNPNDKNPDNVNILMLACYNGCTDIVKYLLSIGLDINDIDDNGNTCMFYTIISNTDFQFYNSNTVNENVQINIIKVLIDNGFDFGEELEYYKDLARNNKRLSVLRFLENL